MKNLSVLNICVFGNQDNGGYRFCKWLREKGHNAHLYMMKRWESERSLPEKVDRYLEADGYPEWIHEYDNSLVNMIVHDRTRIAEIESNYDIVIAIGAMAMTCAHHISKIPLISLSTGPSNQGVIKMWDHLGLKYRVFWTVVRFFVRKSVKKCSKVLVHYDPEIYSLSKLGQLGKAIFYGMPEDVSGNADRVDSTHLAELERRYSRYNKVFLWLGRIDYKNSYSPMYKGTDKFIRAAARVISEGANIKVVMGAHGQDWELAKQMVYDSGIDKNVEWVQHMPYAELLVYLSISNAIVFDELSGLYCVSSGMFREAISVGAILVRSYSSILTRRGYEAADCPVLHAESEEEVYSRMKEILEWSTETMQAEQQKVKTWARKYLDVQRQLDRLISIMEEVIYLHNTDNRLRSWYC
ncbi:MAG: hypothetical protein ACOYW7_01865 [Nitrospirota bacterium]